jgi:hypothetical protein
VRGKHVVWVLIVLRCCGHVVRGRSLGRLLVNLAGHELLVVDALILDGKLQWFMIRLI